MNQAIYELIKVAEQAKPDLEKLNVNALISKHELGDSLKNWNRENTDKTGKPSDYKKKELEILSDISDRIVLMNSGIPSSQELGAHVYEASKFLLVAEIISNLQYKRAALVACEQAYQIAKKNFLLEIAFRSSKLIYSIERRYGNLKKSDKAIKNFKRYLEFYSIESNIEIDRNSLLSYYNSSKSSNSAISNRCDHAISRYSEYVDVIPSCYFHTYYFFFKHVKHTNEKNHLGVFNNAFEALTWLNDSPVEYKPGKLLFIYVLIIHSIQKKQYLKGDYYIKQAITLVHKGSVHWFSIKENELLLNLHRGSYQIGAGIFYKAFNSEAYSRLDLLARQRWKLYEAYTRLLKESKIVEGNEIVTRYSVQKFINDSPRFSKDKRAMNIPLLIAQLLFLIIRRKYDDAVDRITALEKYTTRYLKNNSDTFRSNCFIKMLLEIPKQGFNRTAVERHAQKYYDRLTTSEIELIDQPFEIEIIPYEKLWDIILDNLSKKKRYKTAI